MGAANTHYFNMGSIEYTVEYKKVKTLRLTVYPPDGRLKITVPFGTAPEFIKQFVASKIQWIEKHRKKFIGRSKISGPLRNNSAVYVWGKAYRLELIERRGHPKIIIEDASMKMYIRPLSPKSKMQELLDAWYRRIIKEAAPVIIKKWEEIIGVEVKKLFVRKMKSHWGSCNHIKKTLRLNTELVKRDPMCLEYVIVHEMLHIIEKGHNRNYYRLLNRHFPEWKTIRKKMNSGEI